MVLGAPTFVCGRRRDHDDQQHVANTLLQAAARPHALGQAVSLYMLALSAGFSLGALLTGAMVSAIGVQPALLVDGIAAVVVQVAGAAPRSWARRLSPALAD